MVKLHYKLYKKQRNDDGINWEDVVPAEYIKIPIDYSNCETEDLPYLIEENNNAQLLYQLDGDGVLTESEALSYVYYKSSPSPASYKQYHGDLVITSSVKEIGRQAFNIHIKVPNTSVVYFGTRVNSIDFSRATNLKKIGYCAFQAQGFPSQSGNVITIPDSVEVIENISFSDYHGKVVFSSNSSIQSIGAWAFESASEVYFNTPNPPYASYYAFGEGTRIIVPCEYLETYQTEWSSYANRIQCIQPTDEYRWYPSGTTCIGYDKWNRSIKQVSYDGGQTWENVVPAEYIATTIIEYNSEDCGYVPPTPFDGKFRAEYSNSTTYSAACDSSSSLTTATTRAHSTSYAAMTEAEIGDCVTSIGDNAFKGCIRLTSIDIPSGVTSIGYYAFSGCSSLAIVEIGGGVIGADSFKECNGITSLTINNGVTEIRDRAFSGCTSIASVSIPDSVTIIGNDSFDGCSGITSLSIGNGVTEIGSFAFYRCRSIITVTIGSGVTNIEDAAFRYCSSLTSITINCTTPPSMLSNTVAFDNTNNCQIYVPASSVNAYKIASGWSRYADRIQAIP